MRLSILVRRLILATTIALLPVTLFASESPELTLTDEEQAWIRAHPTLTVANEMDWPPFDFVKDGKPQGYAVDLIHLIDERAS